MYLIAQAILGMLSPAMQHFVFSMKGSAKAPASGLSTEEWFYRYKWDVDGEAFVPIVLDDSADLTEPDVGDILWFVLDEKVLGYAPVLRIMPNNISDNVEIWYDFLAVTVAKGCGHIKTAHHTGRVGPASQGFFEQLRAFIAKNGSPTAV